MATQQMKRSQAKEKTKSWENIFPSEQLTEQKSALFVKKLLAVAISSITYLRAVFPEHAYADKCLEDLNLKILRDENSCPGACHVIKWVRGCFDALEKKYLKALVIGIYVDPNDPETVLETYTFKFTYANDGEIEIYRNDSKISSARTIEETKKATIILLRTIVVLTGSLDSLPENCLMTMKLFYYDEVTPEDYEPPGFKAANPDDFAFNEETTNIGVGKVSTLFHTLRLRVKTSKKQFLFPDELEGCEKESQQNSNPDLDTETFQRSQPVQEICTMPENGPDTDKDEAEEEIDNRMVESPDKVTNNEDQDFQVRCPCGCNQDDGLMVLCSQCNYWQHGICFLITDEAKAPSTHICDICSKIPNIDVMPTDPILKDMSAIAVQTTCLWRRALSACLEFKRIMAPQLARRLGIEVTVAQGLINRLEKEGFVAQKHKLKRHGKAVDKEKIKSEGVPRYLKTPIALAKKINVVADVHEKDYTEMEMASEDSNVINEKENTKPAPNMTPSEIDSEDVNVLHEKKNTKPTLSQTLSGIDALVAKTTKIQLQDGKKNSGVNSSSNVSSCKKERGKKRAYSRMNGSEFEVSNSQESVMTRAKRKASTVAKNIQL